MQHEAEPLEIVEVVCVADPDERLESTRSSRHRRAASVTPDIQLRVLSKWGVLLYFDDLGRVDPRPTETGGLPAFPHVIGQALVTVTASGFAAAVYQLLKAWVDARNGRKLKIKVGDIEVEATQMKEEDVLRIFELLEEKSDRKKIRELLLKASDLQPPENH